MHQYQVYCYLNCHILVDICVAISKILFEQDHAGSWPHVVITVNFTFSDLPCLLIVVQAVPINQPRALQAVANFQPRYLQAVPNLQSRDLQAVPTSHPKYLQVIPASPPTAFQAVSTSQQGNALASASGHSLADSNTNVFTGYFSFSTAGLDCEF